MPEHFDFPPVVHDWVNKGLGMSSRVCATGHIKDPVPVIEKITGGRFPSSFKFHSLSYHQHLSECYTTVCSPPEDCLRCRQGVKPPLKLILGLSSYYIYICIREFTQATQLQVP